MSGKQVKRARKAATAAPPVAKRARERRASPKVLIVAAIAVVAVGAIVGLALVFSGGGSSTSAATTTVPQTGSLTGALPGAARVTAMYRGIAQERNVLGSPKAPVTMLEYVDLQCPYCRSFEIEAMPQLVEKYVRTGKLKVEQRLLAFIGPDSVRGRNAAIAAGDQSALFNLTELLYSHQGTENTGWLSDDLVAAAAASIPGFEVPALLAAQDSSATPAQATEFDAMAKADSVGSTPTILVGRTGEKPRLVTLADAADGAPVAAAIEAALK
jgi:protein-disulfide isomerase